MEKRSTGASPVTVISGVAGLLTAVAALVGLLVTFGVIGGKDDSSTKTTGGTTEQTSDESDGSTSTTAAAASFSVSPKELTLTLLAPEKQLTVTNMGKSTISVQPTVGGPAKAQFTVKNGSCSSEIGPGEYCELTVKFTPGTGESDAVLTISANDDTRRQTVSLVGKPL